MIKTKIYKMYCLINSDNNKLTHYYNLGQIYFKKKDAKINQRYYNDTPLRHKYIIKKCEVKILD